VDPPWGTPPERATRTTGWTNAFHRLFPQNVQHIRSPTTGNWDLTIDCLDGPLEGGCDNEAGYLAPVVDAADHAGVDPRLLFSITPLETGGKHKLGPAQFIALEDLLIAGHAVCNTLVACVDPSLDWCASDLSKAPDSFRKLYSENMMLVGLHNYGPDQYVRDAIPQGRFNNKGDVEGYMKWVAAIHGPSGSWDRSNALICSDGIFTCQ
jgi:hypothetical protein